MEGIYRVAVCDDEPIHLDYIEKETRSILSENGCAFILAAFSSGEALRKAIGGAPDAFDLILLDILLDQDNGVEAARELRRIGCDSTIVFVTSTAAFATKGYEVNAYRYLLKPVNREELADAILSDYRRDRETERITFHKGSQILRIDPRTIRYAEASGHGVAVHCGREEISLPIGISEIEEVLPNSLLVRCHKGFIAGIRFVEHFDRASITISGHGKIPVGRKYCDVVHRTLMNHLAR